MSDSVITIGIDLGTTNSSVAVNIGGTVEIIKKPGGVGYTPSVFGFDKSLNKVVGQKAYEYLYKYGSKNDTANFKSEIKRLMGTPEQVFFERADTSMYPEEISSEILKSLKEDILRKHPGFDAAAAVITVPAAFSVLQSEATKKAGNLAGFKHVVLLQEPIAAASSYGFQNSENENWLIYDLGGGTFDIALISCKDGILSVLGHSGDNFLGGKNVDWEIVDSVIVPKILEQYSLDGFARNNPKFQSVFSNLKYSAEYAKIELSQYEKTTMDIENVGQDDAGREIAVSIELSRQDLERIIKPIIDRTIDLTKATLKEAGIKSSLIKKVVLVGGPTQMPYVKERLASELKVDVDSAVDPLTVVAHGACIFGMSKHIPKELLPDKPRAKGAHEMVLNHSPLTSETEEPVTGAIEGLDEHRQFYVQIQSESGVFSGPKTKITNGKFYYPVNVEPNRQNKFWVYVFDQNGDTVKTSADSFTITHGLSVSGAPIPHSINVVAATRDHSAKRLRDTCDVIFEKGSILPLKKTLDGYMTSKILKKGKDSTLDIKIVEGESEIPDRNSFVCKLGISGKDLPHDLPQGTPVDLTVEYGESREVNVTAYVPLIDMMLNARKTMKDEELDTEAIYDEFDAQEDRIDDAAEHCSAQERKKLTAMANQVRHGLSNMDADEDEKRKSHKQLKDLKIMLDGIEEKNAVPKLVSEHNIKMENLRRLIDSHAGPNIKREIESRFEAIRLDGQRAIKLEDKSLLARINDQIHELEGAVLFSDFNYCVNRFHYLEDLEKGGEFTNESEARYYIEMGRKAIKEKNHDKLNNCIYDLERLLPDSERADFYAGITR